MGLSSLVISATTVCSMGDMRYTLWVSLNVNHIARQWLVHFFLLERLVESGHQPGYKI